VPLSFHVDGVPELINRISKFDKEVSKILNREVKEGADLVGAYARSLVPSGNALSNWGPWNVKTGKTGSIGVVSMSQGSRNLGFDGSAVARGIKPQAVKSSKRGVVVGFKARVVMSTAAGSIWSLAGSQNRSKSSFGPNLNGAFRDPRWPRALTPALHAKGPQARRQIEDAIDRAIAAVNR
jgi:hypothetical protein